MAFEPFRTRAGSVLIRWVNYHIRHVHWLAEKHPGLINHTDVNIDVEGASRENDWHVGAVVAGGVALIPSVAEMTTGAMCWS